MLRNEVRPLSDDPACCLATVRGADPRSVRCRPAFPARFTEVTVIIFCDWPGFPEWARENVRLVLLTRNGRRLEKVVYCENREAGVQISAVFEEPLYCGDIDDLQLYRQRPDGTTAVAYIFAA